VNIKIYKVSIGGIIMWIGRFRNFHKNCLIAPLCKKYGVTDFVYVLNSWKEKRKIYYTDLHILEGSEKSIKRFIKDFKRDKRTLKVEVNGNQILTLNVLEGKNSKYYSSVLDNKLIYIKPVMQKTDGHEEWEVASWDKEIVMKIMDNPDFEMELLSIKKIDGIDLFLPQIQPSLSKKQMETMRLAIKDGYYNSPRKTNLNNLSKKQNVSKQAFQENLSTAENKCIPFLIENIK
jgi:predicted DNA binding protein